MARAQIGRAEGRWRAKPGLATVVRTAAFLGPVAMSAAFAIGAGATLPPAPTTTSRIVMWLIVAAASTGVLLLTDRAARRLLPLAALLNLSIVFPDHAPSRYRVARRAGGVRTLQARLERARQLGVEREPVAAAALILELVTALQHHDRRTRGHSERVHLFTEMLAAELGLPEADRDRLRWAALVHDVGKLTVPADVLNKADAPDPRDWELLRRHPVEGARLCAALRPWMGRWWSAIEQHHEHYDGNGYPRGLAGKDISLGARIVSVADAFEVMTAARSYKQPMSAVAGREELARCAGTQFDPDIVRAFLNISLGRLRIALGPLSWLVQYPALQGAIRTEHLLRLVSGMAAAATTAVLIGAPTSATDGPSPNAATAVAAADRAAGQTGRQPPPVAAVEPRSASRVPPIVVAEDAPFTAVPQVSDLEITEVAPPATQPLPAPPDGPAAGQPASPPPTPTRAPPPATTAPSPAAPTATADTATVAEDGTVTVDVLANDRDHDGDPLRVTAVGVAGIGAAAHNGDGTVTYTPDADVHGVDTFDYEITDGTARATATVTVTITPSPDEPIASDDRYVVERNSQLVVTAPGVQANDRDADDDVLTTTLLSPPAQGTLVLNADGSFTYAANGPAGVFSFTYEVADGTGRSDQATVTIDVGSTVNHSPFWLAGSGTDATTYALTTSPPPRQSPEPDHDADGNLGLSLSDSDGTATETDPAAYQHWTRTFGAPTTYSGQVRLALWSTVADFDGTADGHYHAYLHDCASNGTDCRQLLATDAHIDGWNGGVDDWVFKNVALGSIDHTFAAGRMLRLRLMFRHTAMWIATSGNRPTRIILTGP